MDTRFYFSSFGFPILSVSVSILAYSTRSSSLSSVLCPVSCVLPGHLSFDRNVLPELGKTIFRGPFTSLVLACQSSTHCEERVASRNGAQSVVSQRDGITVSLSRCLSILSIPSTHLLCMSRGSRHRLRRAVADGLSKRSNRVYYFVRPCHSCVCCTLPIKILGGASLRVPGPKFLFPRRLHIPLALCVSLRC